MEARRAREPGGPGAAAHVISVLQAKQGFGYRMGGTEWGVVRKNPTKQNLKLKVAVSR